MTGLTLDPVVGLVVGLGAEQIIDDPHQPRPTFIGIVTPNPPGTQLPPGTRFVVPSDGPPIEIPPGYNGRVGDRGNGIVLQPPLPQGAHRDSNAIRIMDPGADPRYPNGYWKCYNKYGQALNGAGKPGGPADTHFPIAQYPIEPDPAPVDLPMAFE